MDVEDTGHKPSPDYWFWSISGGVRISLTLPRNLLFLQTWRQCRTRMFKLLIFRFSTLLNKKRFVLGHQWLTG